MFAEVRVVLKFVYEQKGTQVFDVTGFIFWVFSALYQLLVILYRIPTPVMDSNSMRLYFNMSCLLFALGEINLLILIT